MLVSESLDDSEDQYMVFYENPLPQMLIKHAIC
jgi:hypothetical protein